MGKIYTNYDEYLQDQLNDEGIPICEYNSQTEAAEVNGIPRTRLCRAMKEGSKYKGYYWKFKE